MSIGAVVRLLGAVAAVALCGLQTAQAELRRCVGPDGRVVYTNDESTCPGESTFEPSGRVQPVDPGEDVPPAARRPAPTRAQRDRAAIMEQAERERWRQKKLNAEMEVERVVSRRGQLKGYLSWCNRGGSVLARDDAGIERRVPCSEIRAELTTLDQREAELRDYVSRGLPTECRRAGCLPGWLR